MSVNEKRAYLRKSLQTTAWVGETAAEDWHPVNLLDISVAGAAFLLRQALPGGVTRRFSFYLPKNPTRISFTAQIMHCTPHTYLSGYRAGVQIASIDASDLALIEQFIAQPGPTSDAA